MHEETFRVYNRPLAKLIRKLMEGMEEGRPDALPENYSGELHLEATFLTGGVTGKIFIGKRI